MTRRLLILAAFLLAGAVVNVVVAWACNHYEDFYQHESKPLADQDRVIWRKYTTDDWPSEPTETFEGRSFGYIERWIVGFTTSAVFDICTVRAGWPAPSLGYDLWREGSGIWGSNRWGDLPVCPVWPGFGLNTLFYTAILLLLSFGPLALRRYVRGKRGLCPACAYPMSESAMCSECGKPLPPQARITT